MVSLSERAARVRLPQASIAKMAGLNKDTVGAVLVRGAYNIRSERLIRGVIEAEERALLEHLKALHPEPAASAPRADVAPHPAPLPADGGRAFLVAE